MANHSFITDTQVIGIHESQNGRVTIDLYCPTELYPDRRFYPAAIDEDDPKKARQLINEVEGIPPGEKKSFLIEDFSGVSRKTGRPFRICRYIAMMGA